jgi:predicted RND superfamily exporter protein
MVSYSDVRQNIEVLFETLGRTLYKRALPATLLLLPVILFLTYQLFFITIDTSIKHYLKEHDPALQNYSTFQEQFGSDERVIVGILTRNIFSPDTLQKISDFQQDIETNVPHISRINSLLNAPYIKNENGDLVFGTLGDLHRGPDGTQIFKDTVLSSPFYEKQFYSPDEKLAIISLPLSCPLANDNSLDVLAGFEQSSTISPESDIAICSLSNTENAAMIAALDQLKDKYQQDDFQIHITGMPLLRQFLRNNMRLDSARFIGLSLLLIIVFLYILFGRLSGVLLPLAIVFCSVSSTVGLMVLREIPFKSPTMVLPSLLMAVGVGGSVHILVLFYKLYGQGLSKQEAIAKALGHSGLPVVLTSLTTAAGLASFATAKVAPVADLGIFAAMGVLISLIYTIFLLPVLISFFPFKRVNQTLSGRFSRPVTLIFDKFAKISTTHSKVIVLFCIGLLLVSCVGISRLQVMHDPLRWLPKSSTLRTSTEILSKHFPGLVTVELLIKTEKERGLLQPDILQKIALLDQQLSKFTTEKLTVFKVSSIVDILQLIHEKLSDDSPPASTLPDTTELIGQELLLLESGSPATLEQLTDTTFQLARITVQAPWVDAMAYSPFLDYIDNESRNIFKENGSVTLTGIIPLLSRTISVAIDSMLTSYLLAFLVISGAMIIFIGDLKLGLISMFPNLLPIFFILGFMGFAGIPLDMYTMLIGSIVLGLVVDDTIHFMYNFRRYFQQTGDVYQSIQKTLHTCGQAILVTTIVLSGGAFIFMASQMVSLFNFGLLSGITIITALFADVLLAPALMTMYYNYKDQSKR